MADLFELIGRMRVEGADKVRSDLSSVSKSGEDAQGKLGGALNKVGGVVVGVGKVAVAGVAAGAAGIAAITKAAIGAYGEYEQLVGGVGKIFEDNAQTVIDNAAKAYETAGLSANDYMQTVTSFSASLVQGLGGDTKAATEYADVAIRDMADNANTYGTAIGDIQNAYQGFAKGNYTMLDNLKLGYGGTQEEMVRLMNDSGVLKEKIESMDDVTFDQMIAGIHATQEKLKITGTTANEAASTIEGSLNSTKAAWANLLTGMGDDTQDFDLLLTNFLDSAGNLVDNVTPRIKMIFDAIPEAVAKIAPQIPKLLESFLPGLISGAIALVAGLVEQLPAILDAIKQAALAGWDALVSAVGEKSPALANTLQTAFDAVKTAINFVIENFDKLVVAVGAAAAAFGAFKLLAFVGEAGSVAAAVVKMTSAIAAGTVAKIADKAETLALQALYAKDAVLKAASTVKTVALTAAQNAAAGAQRLLNAAMNANPIGIIITLIAALVAAFIVLWNNNEDFRNFFIGMWDKIKEVFGAVAEWIGKTLEEIGQWFSETWGAIKTDVETAVNGVKTVVTNVFNAVKNFITTIVNGWKKIITTAWDAIKTAVTSAVNAVKTTVTSVFGAIKSTAESIWNGIKSTVTNVVNGIKSTVTSVFNSVKSTVTTVWNGIKNAITNPIETAKNAVKNAIDAVKGFLSGTLSFPKIKVPHFNISGGEIPWGIGGVGTKPSVSVDWYAEGGIFSKPTIVPTLRGMKGFGEAGDEAVTPISVLQDYITNAVAAQTSGMGDKLEDIYKILAQYLPQAGYGQVVMDTGALVGQIAPTMDRKLGRIYKNQERGRG